MKLIFQCCLLAAFILAGCAPAGSNRQTGDSRPDYFQKRRTVVGSNIPIKPGQLPYSPMAATAPSQSLSRDEPSLYPTEPVVGRTDRGRDPGTRPVNVGAGPPGSAPVLGPTPKPGSKPSPTPDPS